VGQSVSCAAGSASAEPIVSVPVADACCDLLELFAVVSDGRAGQGRIILLRPSWRWPRRLSWPG